MALETVLTHDRPFGPTEHTDITTPQDLITILELHGPISKTLERLPTLVYGRKGSGKSSIINGIKYESQLNERMKKEGFSPLAGSASSIAAIRVQIDTPLKFTALVSDAYHTIFANDPTSYVAPEEMAKKWISAIWLEILLEIDRIAEKDYDMRRLLPNTRGFIHERINQAQAKDLNSFATKLEMDARAEVVRYLTSRKATCLVLFDSIEEYELKKNPRFERTIAGFLFAISKIRAEYPMISVVFAFPEELLPYFRSRSANVMKNFTSTQALKWTPAELMRMVARRLNLYLQIVNSGRVPYFASPNAHDRAAFERLGRIASEHNLNTRDGALDFIKAVLPASITNEFGDQEETLPYVVRHTQLLPRHFIQIFNQIVSEAGSSWLRDGLIPASAVADGIRRSEPLIAAEISNLYATRHPGIYGYVVDCFKEMPPFFDLGTLEKNVRRVARLLDFEGDSTSSFLNLVFDMGVVGVAEPEASNKDRARLGYVNANFAFLPDVEQPQWSSGDLYCIHPIFSRACGSHRRREGDRRLIYPHLPRGWAI